MDLAETEAVSRRIRPHSNRVLDQRKRVASTSELQRGDAGKMECISISRIRGGDVAVNPLGQLEAARAMVLDGLLESRSIRSLGHLRNSFRKSQTGSNQPMSRIDAVRFSANFARTRPPTFKRPRSCSRTMWASEVSAPSNRMSARPNGTGSG
jgi:hypothetical protein